MPTKTFLFLSILLTSTLCVAAVDNYHTIIHYQHEEFILESPGKAKYTVKKKYTRLNASASGGELVLGYDDDYELKDVIVKLYDAKGGNIAQYKEKDFHDQKIEDRISIFLDGRFKALKIEHPNFPYTIEYEYKYEINGIYGINDWHPIAFDTKVESSTYTCKVPKDYILHFKPVNTNIQAQLSTEETQDVYYWEFKNPDIISKEPGMPVSELVLPMVLISPSLFEIEGFKGDMSTWEEFGKFKYAINKDRDELSPNFRKEVLSMTSSCKSDEEKIKVLYKYLQDQCRYVSVQIGIGGWQTFPASYVEEHKYGDCKALTNFMKAMLKVVDIPSYMASISAGDDQSYIDQNFVTGGFNHVILYIPSKDMWLECTRKNTPAGYLGSFTHDRFALVFKEEGGELKRTPAYNYTFNTSTSVTDIYYDLEGHARVKEEKTMKGISQELIALSKEYLDEKEVRERISSSYAVAILKLDTLNILLDEDAPLAKTTTTFTVNRLASKAGNRLFINLTPLQNNLSFPEETINRAHPYQIDYGFTITDTVLIHFPENYELENLSIKETNITEPFGSYSLKLFEEKNRLVIVRNIVLRKVTILRSSYHKYVDFFKEIKKADNSKLVLVNPRP